MYFITTQRGGYLLVYQGYKHVTNQSKVDEMRVGIGNIPLYSGNFETECGTLLFVECGTLLCPSVVVSEPK